MPIELTRATRMDGRTSATLIARSRAVQVAVASADASVVEHALATVRFVAVDAAFW